MVSYSLAQNSIVEHVNLTLLEHTHVMIFSKNISKTLWLDAIAYVCYIKNGSCMHTLRGNTMLYFRVPAPGEYGLSLCI